ncbi:phospholipase D family protein [Maribacter sp. ACAM166]|uniref:phospholipase D family protein n=1 Tax=Maribacter sp. ACAM166 TaxID=2508996 RepID=UPI0010FD0950|nr:phospholipase D family protein [Maribacter sp. ACAM166]TLP71739.1 hypothetical protein ES765_19520 [Maribacter sp. ACAM166]
MSTFLTGKALEKEIDKIIWDAEEILLIVSPYIKLDAHFKKLFEKHSHDDCLKIILVFGKNEKKVSKSLSKQDFEFFKQFPDISIIHAPQLHGKYYGNEKKGVITSVNLYDYSFTHQNIEFGVFNEQSIMDSLKLGKSNVDNDAFNRCMKVAKKNQVVFIRRPLYKTDKGLFKSTTSYLKSEILLDETEYYYGSLKKERTAKKLNDFPDELDVDSKDYKRPEREMKNKPKKAKSVSESIKKKNEMGYCIRTGAEIPFNPEQPLSKEAWKVWNKFGDTNFPEKYCHKTGKNSNGKTSMANPVLLS